VSIQGFMTQTILIKGKVTKNVKSTVKGLINALSARDIYTSAKRNITADYCLYCAADTIVSEADVIECSGTEYDVVFVMNPMSQNMFLKCYLRLVK
jgi:hypothetical protein